MAAHPSSRSSDPPASLIELVEDTHLLAVVVQLGDGRTGRVVAASEVATRRLGQGNSLVGTLASSLLGRPVTELVMLHQGRLRAFESDVSIRQGRNPPVRLKVWVRAIESRPPVQHALVLGVPAVGDDEHGGGLLPPAASAARPQAIGTADAELVVDRVSADVTELLGLSTDDVLNKSLLHLVAPADVSALLVALGQVASSGRGVFIDVLLRTPDSVKLCECVLVPLQPPPSVAFALSEVSGGDRTTGGSASQEFLARIQSTVGAARSSQQLSALRATSSLSRLTSREWEIVQHLLAGDRVPAIAKAMYLSQSTVRSHLSHVFAKLEVTSQQELIDRLRAERS